MDNKGKPVAAQSGDGAQGRIYPCADCGKMLTKAEGGTTFTVCDECWKKAYSKLTEPAERSKAKEESELQRQVAIATQNGARWIQVSVAEIDRLQSELEKAKGDIFELREDLKRSRSATTVAEMNADLWKGKRAALERGLVEARKALREVLNERDTELDMMSCEYPHGTPENTAWHKGVEQAWKRFDVVKARAESALTPEPASQTTYSLSQGRNVYVDCPQFTGYGIAKYDTGERKRCIGVLLENGNIWDYPIEAVRVASEDERDKFPPHMRPASQTEEKK